MYGISLWYSATQKTKPQVLGVSFIPAYAESFGLNAPQTMDALITDLGVRDFRLVSYWSQLEPQPGKYDFRLLDWQFAKAEEAKASVTKSVVAPVGILIRGKVIPPVPCLRFLSADREKQNTRPILMTAHCLGKTAG